MRSFGELIDAKVVRVISLLFRNPEEFYHLQKISENTNIPIATVSRIISKLSVLGAVKTTEVGNFKIYSIADNLKGKDLFESILPIKGIIDAKIHDIVLVFLKSRKDFFHLQKISQESGVAISSASRIVEKLVKNGFVDVTTVGSFKIYSCSKDRKIAQLRRLMLK